MSLNFDLEQNILRCWNITQDLEEILDDLESGQVEIHEAVQALRAFQQVYERRFDRCFRFFEAFNQQAWAWHQAAQDLEKSKTPGRKSGKKGRSKQQKEVDS